MVVLYGYFIWFIQMVIVNGILIYVKYNQCKYYWFLLFNIGRGGYRQNYGGKLLHPPGLSNIDEIDFWLHGLQIWECVIFHFQAKLEAPVETM